MFSRSILLLVLTLCGGVAARAQEAATPPAPIVASDALADDLKEYGTLFERGFGDELIYKINAKIAEMGGAPDPRLLYFRGLAYHRLGWFDDAKADLEIAQAAKIVELPGGFPTQRGLNAIKRFATTMPPKMEEIRQGDRVLFRLHYFNMEGGTATVQGLLPEAHRINSEMFGSDLRATTVLVFDTREQFHAFDTMLTGKEEKRSWVWAKSWGNFVLICLQAPDGNSISLKNHDHFVSTIVHEINHVMFRRLMGWSSQPGWFKEGLAQCAESQIRASFVDRNQRILKRLFENDALLSLEQLTGASYAEQTELGLTMLKGDDRKSAPDTYAQSYGLTKYLLDHISTAQLQSFLNRDRESKDFEGAFKDEFGMTPEQLDGMWRRDYARQLAAR